MRSGPFASGATTDKRGGTSGKGGGKKGGRKKGY